MKSDPVEGPSGPMMFGVSVDQTRETIAERFRELSAQRGIGCVRAERASGVGRSTLFRIRAGQNPNVVVLHRLAVALGVNPAALIEDVPDSAPVPTVIDDRAVRAGIARRVREARKANGWSQSELAVRLSKWQGEVANIERGQHLSAHTARRLAAALDRPLWWLLWGD